MSVIIRMITTKEYRGSSEDFAQLFLRSVKMAGDAKVLKSGDYHKMLGHQEILFEVKECLNFADLVQLTGKAPVLNSENEAIFDVSQGSDICINEIHWIHLEVMQDIKQ